MKTQYKKRKDVTLPNTFEPKFWTGLDNRLEVVKTINRRLARLKKESGAESIQKEMLCEEAIFISLQLETARVRAMETGEINIPVMTQMVNCLSGLLSKLGLKKQAAKAIDVQEYMKRKGKKP